MLFSFCKACDVVNYLGVQRKASHFFLLLFLLSQTSIIAGNRRTIDSLVKLTQKIPADSTVVYNLNLLSREYLNFDSDSALRSAQTALDISVRLKYKSGITNSYNRIGLVHYFKGDYAKAVNFYLKSLKEAEKNDDKKSIASAYNGLGLAYYGLGNSKKALECYNNSIPFRKEVRDTFGLGNTFNNIGLIYIYTRDYPNALFNLKNSLRLFEAIHYNPGIIMNLNNIGLAYNDQGDYSNAIENYLKSLKINEEIDDKQSTCVLLKNIGITYLNKGTASKKREDFDSALAFCSRSLDIAVRLDFKDELTGIYSTMAKIYEQKKDYPAAFRYQKLYSDLKDTIFTAESSKTIAEMQTKYETQKKELQLSAQDAQLKKERTQRFALYGGLGLVVFFSIVIFNRFRLTRKQKAIIEKQNAEVVKAYEKLHEKNKEVMDSIYYARRIQTALLTNEKYITRALGKLRKYQDNSTKK